ncbi:MAG: hypothetical protein RLZZ151_387, partial [Pseudomonadota bacterium]
MTTIKLSKKPSDQTAAKTGKAPVRRTDPSKRDRTVAPKPFVKTLETSINEPSKETNRTPASNTEQVSSKASQRNHRYDGRLRDEAPRQQARPTLDDTGRDTPRRGG